jgi:hypothetical protein
MLDYRHYKPILNPNTISCNNTRTRWTASHILDIKGQYQKICLSARGELDESGAGAAQNDFVRLVTLAVGCRKVVRGGD